MSSLRRFQPSATNPWNRVKAAHLLNRAGFGASPEVVSRLAGTRLESAVDELLNYHSVPDTAFPEIDFTAIHQMYEELVRLRRARADRRTIRSAANQLNRANREKFQELRANWVGRMIRSSRPLQEKMVLFWHGFLVSGFPETRAAEHMAIQLDLFRRMATGNFKELILAISRDSAMLSYLDNNTNRKGRPNENYARELLELFTMGIGNYTEQDIKEAARAFTGWTFVGNEFVFRPAWHDDGVKTFLGRSGNWDGSDIINIIFEHQATARFLPRKLFEFFVYQAPEERLVEELAGIFKRSSWEVKPVLRTLFLSEAFYSEKAMRTQVKSPAQLVIGAARAMGTEIPAPALVRAMDLMGQALLYPPNVGGWPIGKGWINTASVLLRYNFSTLLLNGAMPGVGGGRRASPTRVEHLIDAVKTKTAGDVVDQLVDRFVQSPLDRRRKWGLLRAFGTNREDMPIAATGANFQSQLRSAVHLVMSMPEYQLT
jgi:hypothetical protein